MYKYSIITELEVEKTSWFALCDDYFEEIRTFLENNGLSKEEYIYYHNKKYVDFAQKAILFIKENNTELNVLIRDITLAICGFYYPTIDNLDLIISIFEELVKNESLCLLRALFEYDPACEFGVSAHNLIGYCFINDQNFLFDSFQNNFGFDGYICCENNRRFCGLVPYIFENGNIEQKNKITDICLALVEKIPENIGTIVISLLNFTKMSDHLLYEKLKSECHKVANIGDEEFRSKRLSDIAGVNLPSIKKEKKDCFIFEIID